MKAVMEMNWAILLILIGGLIAFVIIVAFNYDLQTRLVKWVETFKPSDLISSWQQVLKK